MLTTIFDVDSVMNALICFLHLQGVSYRQDVVDVQLLVRRRFIDLAALDHVSGCARQN